jgi:hypothetical protein
VFGDVPWIITGEKFDKEECVFVKIAIELEVKPIVFEFHTANSVMQGKPFNIAL